MAGLVPAMTVSMETPRKNCPPRIEPPQRFELRRGRCREIFGILFVGTPSSEQKSAPRLGARNLLNIGQVDAVMFHQKLDCHRNDQERRNVLFGGSTAVIFEALQNELKTIRSAGS
jgi:hypothetical protein